jgi:hypothetical protein
MRNAFAAQAAPTRYTYTLERVIQVKIHGAKRCIHYIEDGLCAVKRDNLTLWLTFL